MTRRLAVFWVPLIAGVALPAVASAQCYSRANPRSVSDACDTTTMPDAYEYTEPRDAFFAPPNTLLLNLGNDLVVFDVSAPLSPVKLKQVHLP